MSGRSGDLLDRSESGDVDQSSLQIGKGWKEFPDHLPSEQLEPLLEVLDSRAKVVFQP